MSLRELSEWVEADDERAEWLRKHRFFKTSGSGGEEKWVALSEQALEWSARSVVRALGICEDDVLGLALPEVHVGGYGVRVRAGVSGARLARFEGRWNAILFSKWCEEEGVSILSLVPTQLHDLVAEGCHGGDDLRVVVVGGGALDGKLAEEARALGWPVSPSYGMTETSSQVATGEDLPLLPGWEAKVVDGCLVLKGGGLLTAVIRRACEGFRAVDPKVDGWFLTQDRVELEDGKLRVLGRADRLVKVMGELVDLEDLERFWREKLRRELAIVTRHDDRRGVSLKLFFEAFVEGREEGSEVRRNSEIERINAGLAGPSRLSDWEEVTRLPRSPLGKIDRYALSKRSTE